MFRNSSLVLIVCCFPLPAVGQRAVAAGPNVWVSMQRGAIVQVEPVVAADPNEPNRLIVAAIGLRRPHASDWQDHQTILVYESGDGGRSWSPRKMAPLPDSWTAGDPWLAWIKPDDLILSAIAGKSITRRGDPPARARLFHSRDGGINWDWGGQTPFPASSAEDHPVLAARWADYQASAYVVATHATSRAEGVDAVQIGMSDLVGASPVTPLRPVVGQVNLGGAVVHPGGDLIVSFYSMLPPRGLWSARLSANLNAWSVTRIRESILPVGFPSLAVDRSSGRFRGRIYSVWVESEDQADLRVLCAWSDDAGTTWSAPVQVHADTTRIIRALPAVAVASDGVVGVIWQDRRHAEGRDCSDLYGTLSMNGGATFLPEVRVSSETACPYGEENGAAASRFRLGGGDYEGLTGIGPGAFQAVWSDSRTGRYQVWTAWVKLR